jgi:hypothetical protein
MCELPRSMRWGELEETALRKQYRDFTQGLSPTCKEP